MFQPLREEMPQCHCKTLLPFCNFCLVLSWYVLSEAAAIGLTRSAPPHRLPSRIGGWNDRPVSHGKKIQVSCDTSVMKVSTSGLPIGLA